MVGEVAIRKSISWPRTDRRMRPSWGSLRSAMFRPAITLIREIKAAFKWAGKVT